MMMQIVEYLYLKIIDPLEQYLWLQAMSLIRSHKIIRNLMLRL